MSIQEKYQCHICMETANKPIVTPCGHLFCWQCIYHWLRSNQEFLTCPLCKSGLELSSVRPILMKNEPPEKEEDGIPPRPLPFRKVKQNKNPRQIPKALQEMGMNVQRGVLLAGYGIFPSVYQCLFQNYKQPSHDSVNGVSLESGLYGYVKKATWLIILLAFVTLILY